MQGSGHNHNKCLSYLHGAHVILDLLQRGRGDKIFDEPKGYNQVGGIAVQ